MRIVCLSAEAAEICFRLGAEADVVAVSAFASRQAAKPIVSGFSHGNVENVVRANPELVVTFSDVQAGLAESLIKRGIPVLALNHFTISGVLDSIRLLGRVLGRGEAAEKLGDSFLVKLRDLTYSPAIRPRVYFEEWDDPMIVGIPWISEIIQMAGGDDIFAERSAKKAEQRVVGIDEVVAANPQIILASWCGKPVDIGSIRAREGFEAIEAVRAGQIHELAPEIILQAGPALVSGLEEIGRIVREWVGRSA
ncbi:MAG: ABC transporter substrate-binding protein [Verrucomicrobia bacterium]|nr:ABC transporter substrate-binding protein [Verrucomicrobiota bacterium]